MDESRLRWVQYNRAEPGHRPQPPVATSRTQAREQWEAARRGSPGLAGELVRSALQARTKLSVVQRRLLAMLEEQVGGELLDHVTLVGVSRGILRLETAEAAVLYDLRLRWEQRLLRLVDTHLPEMGIHTVRFALARHQDRPRTGRE